MKVLLVLTLLLSLAACSSAKAGSTPNTASADSDYDVDLSGHTSGQSEKQIIDGICSPSSDGTELKCDVYNGYQSLVVSEVTIAVIMDTTTSDPARIFRVPATIPSLSTSTVQFKLGGNLAHDTFWKENRLTHWGFAIIHMKAHSK